MQASVKSLVEQVIEAWLAELERSDHLDSSALERIKHLISRREFGKSARIASAIRAKIEGSNENT